MKYKIKLSVYPLEGAFLPAEEGTTWIEDSKLNTKELLKQLRKGVLSVGGEE